MALQTLTFTNSGTTYLDISEYVTLVNPTRTLTNVSVPYLSCEPKIVYSSVLSYITAGQAPSCDTSVGFWDLSAGLEEISISVDQVSDYTLTSSQQQLNNDVNFAGTEVVFFANVTENGQGEFPNQAFVHSAETSATITWTSALPPTFTQQGNVITPPKGTPFYTNSGEFLQFVVDPNGQDFGTNGYGHSDLTSGLSNGLGGDYSPSYDYAFAWQDSITKTSSILYSGLSVQGSQPFGPIDVIQMIDANGISQSAFAIELAGITGTLSIQGAVAGGYYTFTGSGSMYLINPISRTFEVYVFSAQDTVASACLNNCNMRTFRNGCMVSNNAGSFILTTCGVWYEFTPTTGTFYTAISSPGSGPPPPVSMSLTLTSLSGTHGTPLVLDGIYDYVSANPPTALDIGYLQSDGSVLWVDAASSTIGTTTPTGGFVSTGGTLA